MAKSEKIYKAILLTVVALIGVMVLFFMFGMNKTSAKTEINTGEITELKLTDERIKADQGVTSTIIKAMAEDLGEVKSDVKTLLSR